MQCRRLRVASAVLFVRQVYVIGPCTPHKFATTAFEGAPVRLARLHVEAAIPMSLA